MGWKMGFEPTTLGTTILYSNQLSYIHRVDLFPNRCANIRTFYYYSKFLALIFNFQTKETFCTLLYDCGGEFAPVGGVAWGAVVAGRKHLAKTLRGDDNTIIAHLTVDRIKCGHQAVVLCLSMSSEH